MNNRDAMKSPIGKMVDGVFFWVRDLQASIEQYSQLFGISIDEAYHFVQSLGFEITFGIFRNEYVAFFDMRDADRNRIKICQQF